VFGRVVCRLTAGLLCFSATSCAFAQDFAKELVATEANLEQYERIEIQLTPPADLGASVIGYFDHEGGLVLAYGLSRQLLTNDSLTIYPTSTNTYYIRWKTEEFDAPTYYPNSEVVSETETIYFLERGRVLVKSAGEWQKIEDEHEGMEIRLTVEELLGEILTAIDERLKAE